MSCERYRQALTADGRSPSPELLEHAASCPACERFAARLRAAETLLAEPAARETDRTPPADFAAGVLAALPEGPDPLTWATFRLLPVTAALTLALLGWCWLATPPPSELWAEAAAASAAAEDSLLVWVGSDDD